MKAAAKGASGPSRQRVDKGGVVDNHDGDSELIVAELYVTHRKPLEEYLRRFVNEHDARDIVHDVFLKLFRSLPTWITSQDARRFLFVAARSKAQDLHCKLARCDSWDPVVLDSVESNRSPDGETSLEMLDALLDGRLEPDLRRVLIRRWDGVGLRHIAEMEGVSVASINRRLLKIKRILRNIKRK